jgi:hypothetical protein
VKPSVEEAFARNECLTCGKIDPAVRHLGGDCPYCHFRRWDNRAEELDVVILKRAVGPLPAGSKGTVVAVWGVHGLNYTVEFTSPTCLIEITLDDIELSDETVPIGIEKTSR